MKKILTLVLAIVMLMSLCACVSQEDFDAEVSRHQEEISRLETQLQTLQDQNARQEEANRSLMEKNAELENKLNEYSWVIGALENGDYDHIIYRTEEIRREKELEALAALGVREVAVTLENWQEYFEPTVFGYSYIKNSFGEATLVNVAGGLKLKDGYRLAEDTESLVKFGFVMETETRSCTVNFDTLEISFGEPVESSYYRKENNTTSFQYSGDISLMFADRPRYTTGIGYIDQVNDDKGRTVTENVTIYKIVEMLRVEGTLYIYGN